MQTILIVIGTRPEAIKMAPLINEFRKYPEKINTKLCVTAQHRHMLDQVLDFFAITPDFDLDLMRPGQNLFQLTGDVIVKMKDVLESCNPDYVFVHGDTTTSTAAALAAFYHGSTVCHVEAGLRTNNKKSPFPEEMNRQITGRIAQYHFAPTELAKSNLLRENIAEECIMITGNTVIDALMYAKEKVEAIDDKEIEFLKNMVNPTQKIVLVTGHRRENFGEGIINICNALLEISRDESVQVIYPVHLNPNIQGPVNSLLGQRENIRLIAPLSYPAFVWLMKRSDLILTDSGGIQEEAPSLQKPVLVMRNNTERPEALSTKLVHLVGTNIDTIVNTVQLYLNRSRAQDTIEAKNPFGDGDACEKIVSFILQTATMKNKLSNKSEQ